MKPLATRRSAPLRPSVDERASKKTRLTREIDVRRWKALVAFWNFLTAKGMKLNLARIGRRMGLENGTMASHVLNGNAPLNERWMLAFSQEMGSVPPQVVWGEDWHFSDLTPDYRDGKLERVIRCWGVMRSEARQKLITMAESAANFRLFPGNCRGGAEYLAPPRRLFP